MSFIEDEEAFGVFAKGQDDAEGLHLEELAEHEEMHHETEKMEEEDAERLGNGRIFVKMKVRRQQKMPRK